jgi:phage shock protein PspC (stress-responsive transcriptional regulator)
MYHRIKRARGKDAKVFGVLAGISKHLDPDWDPLIIRLVFIVLAAFSGFVFMFALYLLLALVLHKEDCEIEEGECVSTEDKDSGNFKDFKVKEDKDEDI